MEPTTNPPACDIRRLIGADAERFRELRLLGLRLHPEAFGASFDEESVLPVSWYSDRLDQSIVFGGGIAGASDLHGIVGFALPDSSKSKRKGILWGMFVHPEARGSGLGSALVAKVIEYASHLVDEIKLTVVSSNVDAIRLYRQAGFKEYGVEPRAFKVDGSNCSEVLMSLRLPLDPQDPLTTIRMAPDVGNLRNRVGR